MINQVCVFCASSRKVDQLYFNVTERFAKVLARHHIALKYGGGAVGLMGTLSNTLLNEGGYVTGVIPEFMIEMEWANKSVQELVVTKDMHDRKRKMIENVDAVIALPGGIGTLEELTEVITLKQLGQFVKPIIIFNINDFFAPLLAMLDKMINDKFMRFEHRYIWQVTDDPDNIPELIEKAPEWDRSIIKTAQI